eukprot:CAMPEP_0171091278 /NCGR_PEP_ID=MMETSP0766_2-20121228/32392_1 /TAXON_ID=439317 /ORGANISM="Gambierdiscus australes, Strain CAWD 149" /LENGTH=87 /DNA_ID=CAMNT_0011549361 /DNA_START=50 /DNA_END=314 /DNA_ORIENTATION=+
MAAAPCDLVGTAARQQGTRERHGAPRVPKHLQRGQWYNSLAPVREVDEESDKKVAKADRQASTAGEPAAITSQVQATCFQPQVLCEG